METAGDEKIGTPLKILFVDDEKNVLMSLRRLFMDEEYKVIIANSGQEALEILERNPDTGLIVSDQRMPGMTGVDFLEKARGILPDALRILLTGYADINAVADAINRGGAYRYITKPWNDNELLQTINEASNRYSLINENRKLHAIVEAQNEELQKWNSQLEFFVQEQTLEIQNQNKELENLNENLKNNFRNSIAAFSGLLELRDKKTCNHSKNVAAISSKIADTMELPSNEIETITVAALLHDIGKIGIPDILLLQDFEEMDEKGKKEYMQHPVRGQAAIDSIEDLRPAGILIRHHHEYYNGLGYPDKLAADRIPVGSRIIAAADYFENTIRKYADNDAVNLTLSEMKDHLSKKIDPGLYTPLEAAVRTIYANTVRTDMVEKEIGIEDVRLGMVLSRDVKSGTGITLLIKGTKLANNNIPALKRYFQLDPSNTGIFIWEKN